MTLNDGEINVRKTHPNLYWQLMIIAVGGIALAVNFWFLKPTFPIWDIPNAVWAGIFLVTSLARIITLNFYRRLRWVRFTMVFSVIYTAFLAVGTAQPGWEGKASFQLPIVYAIVVAIQIPFLFEPFVNPATVKK